MAMGQQDKELQQYRDLMPVPDEFEEGFGVRTIVAVIFLSFFMVPASIYLSLFLGQNLGPAARWTTVILFAEVAKRSMTSLRRQEIFILFYMTSLTAINPFMGPLWQQYLADNEWLLAMGIQTPGWIAPSQAEIDEHGRTFFTQAWLGPILYIMGFMAFQRIDHFSLGYVFYRVTAHAERLPFPMAPIGALAVTALADVSEKSERWKWKWFSGGATVGLAFGALYIGIPAVSAAFLARPVLLIPAPFLDLTPVLSTENFLPATPLNVVFELGLVIVGMVIPFWAVIGGLVGLVSTWVLNPILYENGLLTSWEPGMGLVDTQYYASVDFYLSFGIGLSLAIFVVTMWGLIRPLFKARAERTAAQELDPETAAELERERSGLQEMLRVDPNRGDLSIFVALGLYLLVVVTYILWCLYLLPGTPERNYEDRFPWLFFLAFGLIYQPIMSYITAKLEGLIGQSLQIPMIREAAYILSGYRGAEIWFAPIPIFNQYGGAVADFRQAELLGTKVTSLIKTELLTIPIFVVTFLLFSELIWRMSPVPSAAYPYANELWELAVRNFALTATATMDGSSPFMDALKPGVILSGLGAGIVSFITLAFLNLPTLLVYGVVRGLGMTTPGAVIPELFGALLARFWLEKKFGRQNFKKYIMIFSAGFGAGMGFVGMGAVALALIAKSTTSLPY